MNGTITLTGYLGKDPQIRETQERTYTQASQPQTLIFEHAGRRVYDRADDIAEEPAEYDVTVPSRAFAVLSLATHDWVGPERLTTWHRVVVWNVERLEFMGVRIARKGSKVELTGRLTAFETRDGRRLEQVELSEFRILELK